MNKFSKVDLIFFNLIPSLFILLLFYAKLSHTTELTIYLDNWTTNIPESYNVHTNEYIYLEKNSNSFLTDELSAVSSMNAVRSGPEGSQTSLFTRGTESNHTLVTINSSPITDHSTTNGLTDLGLLNINFADRLHLIEGPMSTLYGPNAVGGVVDVQVANKYQNLFSTTYGSHNKSKIGIENSFGDNNEYSFGIYSDTSDGISTYPSGSEKDGFSSFAYNLGYSGISK